MFGEGVAGYYDPRSKRLKLVDGATAGPLAEIVLAHELNHALEDQHFGLAPDETATDDAALARVALIEGTAMLVMQQYVQRYIGTGEALSAALGSAMSGQPDLPKFVQDQLIFPYLGGLQFAAFLQGADGGGWATLDEAAAGRVPESTEQILHPEKYLAGAEPERVRLSVRLGSDWRRATAGTWGEWQTAQLVGGEAPGWGGDRYELWQRGSCTAPPCRSEDVLVMRWAWDTPEAARAFEAKLRERGGRERRRRRGGFPPRHRHARAGSVRPRWRELSPATLEARRPPGGPVLLTISSSRASTSARIFVFCASVSFLSLTA